MIDSTELIKKIAQLTIIREKETLVDTFFQLMLRQFDCLEAIALYRHEQPEPEIEREAKEISLSLDAVLQKSNDEIFSHAFSKEIASFIPNNTETEERLQSVLGHNVLIVKSNRNKQFVFYLIYLFSGSLEKENDAAQTQMIRYLSQIYTNHQMMISMNDKDSLTDLYNRKSFDRQMERFLKNNTEQINRHQDEIENNICLAILDLDHFKWINDRFGHLYGDEILFLFAQQMQNVFRGDDLSFRYGGEEFVVILIDVDYQTAEKVLQRFRKHIESYQFPQNLQVTVSVGLTQLENNSMQSVIMDRADQALYYAKEHGRNNVVCYEKLLQDGSLDELLSEDDIQDF